MIKTNTLFILGAGASKPFGYPTGEELRNEILSDNRYDKDIVSTLNPYDDNIEDFYQEIREFKEAFTGAGVYSIDSFLEHNPKFMNIGKIFIARMLISHEEDGDLRRTDGNWYMYLFDRMKSSFEELGENNISFITFNYDRSLEYFLFEAIKNQFSKEPDECKKMMKNFPIVHLYGQLDPLPWQEPCGKAYSYSSAKSHIGRLRAAPKNIKLISDERGVEKSEEFQEAYKLIQKVERIFFLGFSFDKTNLKRLKINLMDGKKIIATAHNLEKTKVDWVGNCFRKRTNALPNMLSGKKLLYDADALTLLKNHLEIED